MKKLALLLFGLSLYKNRNHVDYLTKIYNIDWRFSYDNYQEYIIEFFKRKGFNIDIYLVSNTLKEEDKQELLNKWKPKGYDFLDVNNDPSCRFRQRNEKIIRVIELCKESQLNYDNILITRFDLKFKIDFDKLPLDYNMFNSAFFITESLMCDNFLFMTPHSLEVFYRNTKQNKDLLGHKFKKHIEKEIPINFLFHLPDKTQLPYNIFYDLEKQHNYTKKNLKYWKL